MSIADKLTTIAENMQALYDAGNILANTTSWGYMFYMGHRLELLPHLKYDDTKGVTDMYYAFSNAFETADSVREIPKLNTSNVNDFSGCFYQCSYLTEFPDFDFSNGTKFYAAFQRSNRLSNVPDLDLKSAINCSYMFANMTRLTSVGVLDTRNCENFSYLFYYCTALTEIKSINLSNATNTTSIFQKCSKLKNITFVGTIPMSLDLSVSTAITYDSIMRAINALADNSESTTTFTLRLGSTNLKKITDEEKAIATEKGWTLA